MYNLPECFRDLSEKRQKEIAEICFFERQDAALNAVVIGLKCMNQVHGFGLQRLCKLSSVWGDNITHYYGSGGIRYKEYPELGIADAGSVMCNVDERFADLSPRRRRIIAGFLFEERKDAQWNAALIGLDTIQKELHFGEKRTEQLTTQWEYDIRDFYQNRDINEPRLKAWIEDVGFLFENGRLQSWRTENGNKPVRKATAEKWMQQEDANAAK